MTTPWLKALSFPLSALIGLLICTAARAQEPAPSEEPDAIPADQQVPAATTEEAAEEAAEGQPEAEPEPETEPETALGAEDEPGAEAEDDQTPAPPMRAQEVAFWSLAGAAGFALLTGALFGITALAEEQRYEENPSDQARDRGEARALAADIFLGVGAAAAVAAAIVWLTDDGDDEAPAEAPADSATIAPAVSGNTAGIEIRF